MHKIEKLVNNIKSDDVKMVYYRPLNKSELKKAIDFCFDYIADKNKLTKNYTLIATLTRILIWQRDNLVPSIEPITDSNDISMNLAWIYYHAGLLMASISICSLSDSEEMNILGYRLEQLKKFYKERAEGGLDSDRKKESEQMFKLFDNLILVIEND